MSIENIPPSEGALKQHVLRSILLSTKWHKALELTPDLPSPSDWGWVNDKNGFWVPHWSDDPIVVYIPFRSSFAVVAKSAAQAIVPVASTALTAPRYVHAMH